MLKVFVLLLFSTRRPLPSSLPHRDSDIVPEAIILPSDPCTRCGPSLGQIMPTAIEIEEPKKQTAPIQRTAWGQVARTTYRLGLRVKVGRKGAHPRTSRRRGTKKLAKDVCVAYGAFGRSADLFFTRRNTCSQTRDKSAICALPCRILFVFILLILCYLSRGGINTCITGCSSDSKKMGKLFCHRNPQVAIEPLLLSTAHAVGYMRLSR